MILGFISLEMEGSELFTSLAGGSGLKFVTSGSALSELARTGAPSGCGGRPGDTLRDLTGDF